MLFSSFSFGYPQHDSNMEAFKILSLIFSVFYLTVAEENILTGRNYFASERQLPFVVSLSCLSKESGETVVCSGSIIDHQHVLTSASCIADCGLYHIRYNSVAVHAGGKTLEAISTFVHPFFKADSVKYDVALIRTTPNALLSAPTVRVADVLDYNLKSDHIKDSPVIAVGWGQSGANKSPAMQFAKGKISSDSVLDGNFFLRANFGGYSDEHSYDSGSPLLVRFGHKWVQIGIATSHNNNKYGLFTSLFSKSIHTFINRILNHI